MDSVPAGTGASTRADGSDASPDASGPDGAAAPEASTAPECLELRVLGHIEAASPSGTLDLGGPRQRAVLARLALARGSLVSAEQLVEALWGETAPASATASLQTYVSHLRRRLQPDRRGRDRGGVVVSEAGGYALRLPEDAVDAWRFERMLRETGRGLPEDARGIDGVVSVLQQALALWRGPAYAGFASEPWAEAEVARLTELRSLASEQLLAARLARGEAALVVPELEVLVDSDPLREERWRLLVLALYRSGRQADALAALRRARSTLADELGVDPGPALRALEAEVLAQSPSLDAAIPPPRAPRPDPAPRDESTSGTPAAPPTPTPTQTPTPTRPRRPADPIVDRDREVAELAASLADAIDGQGRLTLISGPAGIGKSRLVAEARQLAAESGATLLTARCSELEREFGFGAVRQLFEPLLHDAGRREDMLRGSAAAASPVFDLGAGDRGPAEESSFATLHGLYWLTVNLTAGGPLVLVVDDLHWCDVGSLRFLTYLVRRLEGLPVLLVATRRTGEDLTDAALVDELEADVATVPIRLGPLTTAGLRAIISSRLGADPDPAFTAACQETSSGNPLLLRQLLRALQSDGLRPDAAHADTARALGSRAIGSMVQLRLRRLSPSAMKVARALAVLGDGATLPVVAALAGLDESEAAQATSALVRAEVLRPESPLGFVHALVRSAVLADLAPGERELLHDRAARLLHRAGASSEQVAAQLLAAPARADGWAVTMLRTAAAEALRRGVPDSAMSYLRRAMAEPPAPAERPDVLLELARAEVSIDGPAAMAHLREAYATLQDPARRAFAALALARTMVFVAPRGDAAVFAHEAREALPAELVDERQGLLAVGRISVHMHGLDADAWGLAAAGHPLPEIVGDGPGARMLAAQLAWEHLSRVEPEEALRLARWALEGGVLYAVDNGLLWVVATMVQDLADIDVMPLWDEAIALAHRRGSLFSVLSVSLWRGYSLFRRGDLPEAEVSLGVAVDQLTMWQAPGTGAAYAEAQRLQALLEMDRLAEARARFASVAPGTSGSDGERLLLETEAEILLAEGRSAPAVPLLQRAATIVPQMRNPAWRRGPALLADVLAAMGRTDDALALLDGQLELARRWGAPGTLGPLLRRRGTLLLVADEAAGVAELTEAERLLAASDLRVEHGKALLALGTALLGRPTERALAIGLLLQAVEVAESTSAARLRREATDALAEAGVAVPALRRTGLAGLSTTRRRIAMLVADGVALHEIAESLFLTPRAVENHLAEVRRRLGIGDTDDLSAALAAAVEASAVDAPGELTRRR